MDIKLKSVQFGNFLSFKNSISINDIGAINTFVGPNNSGKSNLFRLMKFYQNLTTDYVKNAQITNIRDKFHQQNKTDGFSLSLKYNLEQSEPRLSMGLSHTLSYDAKGNFLKEQMVVECRDNKKQIVLMRKENKKSFKQNPELVYQLFYGGKSSVWSSNEYEGILSEISNIDSAPFLWEVESDDLVDQIYNSVKEFVRGWAFIDVDRKVTPEFETRMSNYLTSDQKKVTNQTIADISEFIGIDDIYFEDDEGKKVSNFIESDVKNRLELMGSGMEQIYSMFPFFMTHSTMYFIEEPELHLHALMQRKLFEKFKTISETKQVFLNTHSPIFCQSSMDSEIQTFIVGKNDQATFIEKIDKEKLYEIRSLLGHINLDLFVYNAVLIVEGPTEYESLPIMADTLKINLVNDGVMLLNSNGYDNISALENIIRLLKGAKIAIYVLCDDHSTTNRNISTIKHLIESRNIIELGNGFEEEFDNDIITNAFEELLLEHQIKLEGNEKEELFKQLNSRKNTKAFKVLCDFIYESKSLEPMIRKPELGIKIAQYIKRNNLHGKSRPEKLLMQIHNDMVTLIKDQ